MTLVEVKQYLRIDGDEEDNLIYLMMEAAEEYIKSAVGTLDETKSRVKMLYLACVQDMYDNRQLVAVSSTGYSASQYFRHMIDSLVMQLQAEELLPPELEPEPDPEPDQEEGDGNV